MKDRERERERERGLVHMCLVLRYMDTLVHTTYNNNDIDWSIYTFFILNFLPGSSYTSCALMTQISFWGNTIAVRLLP
jgi:hypothetical protein